LIKYFAKDIEQRTKFSKSKDGYLSEPDSKVGAFTQYQPQHWGVTVNDKIMPIHDQIKFYVEHNKSFMLHGSSGVGKSLRVKDIDPDLTFIHIPNGVLPESILGKVIYSNGKSGIPLEFVNKLRIIAQQNNVDIDEILKDEYISSDAGEWKAPDWYVEVCDKCQREPNKQHVLFIDEITNAKPTTQSLVYHIILERSIGPNKGKLPDNCVIVAAGNNIDERDASYNMPEPLFRRFDGHIYIKPNVSDWILWGSKKVGRNKETIQRVITPINKINDRYEIHPLVSAFIASAPDCMMSEFKPDSQISFAIDQRGWDQVSDIIYDNNGELRYELIRNKVGDEIAKSFIEFAKNPPLTLDNILSNNYTKLDIPTKEEEKLVLTSLLRYADERQVETVRDFVKHNLGKEMLAIFDSLWCDGDTEREVFIANMNQTI
jgi:MoxR-like ATPase